MTGTTKRSLRMVTNSSCSTSSSRCRRRKRSSDSWIELLLLLDVAAQARQFRAGVIGDGAVGQDLAGQVLRPASGIRRCPGSAPPAAGTRPATEASTRRTSEATSSNPVSSRISLASRQAPSMRSFASASAGSGSESKRRRTAAPRAAGCGREAAWRYSIASPASARLLSSAERSVDGSIFSISSRPRGLET